MVPGMTFRIVYRTAKIFGNKAFGIIPNQKKSDDKTRSIKAHNQISHTESYSSEQVDPFPEFHARANNGLQCKVAMPIYSSVLVYCGLAKVRWLFVPCILQAKQPCPR